MNPEDHMDELEMVRGIQSMAVITRHYYAGLIEQGFGERDALDLTKTWLAAATRGSHSADG